VGADRAVLMVFGGGIEPLALRGLFPISATGRGRSQDAGEPSRRGAQKCNSDRGTREAEQSEMVEMVHNVRHKFPIYRRKGLETRHLGGKADENPVTEVAKMAGFQAFFVVSGRALGYNHKTAGTFSAFHIALPNRGNRDI